MLRALLTPLENIAPKQSLEAAKTTRCAGNTLPPTFTTTSHNCPRFRKMFILAKAFSEYFSASESEIYKCGDHALEKQFQQNETARSISILNGAKSYTKESEEKFVSVKIVSQHKKEFFGCHSTCTQQKSHVYAYFHVRIDCKHRFQPWQRKQRVLK